jgi:hypothetical protein
MNQEKYDIITKALHCIETNSHIFICNAIEAAAGISVFRIIPELLDYKPNGISKSSPWWRVNSEGYLERVRVLKELQKRFENE